MTALPALTIRRAAAALLACGLAVALAACFVLPGQFTSTLDIRKDGRFSYSYQGEIFMFVFSELNDAAKPEEFSPITCFDGDTGEERTCSKDELAQQRKEWDEGAERRKAKRQRELEEMRVFLGGIDPSDPKAAEKFADKLQRQAGWRRMVSKGNGLFDVDFAINGTLTYDFAFPTMEQVNNSMPFLQLSIRNDGTVRMDAPVFGTKANDPLRLMMGQNFPDSGEDKKIPNAPKVRGTFTLTTDGQILSNNTDQGPQADAAGQKLHWTIGEQDNLAAPMALIKLSR